MKLIVAGTRTFDDYALLRDRLDYYLSNVHEEIEIVSGGAKGADSLGERYAREHGLPVKLFSAEWDCTGGLPGHSGMVVWPTMRIMPSSSGMGDRPDRKT